MTATAIPMPTKPHPPTAFSGKAWQQVLARDSSADGRFVYAVKSTGVYCKPSCPSRRPERRNVTFFTTVDEAEAAGFRACLRCEPRLSAPRRDPQADAVEQACALLHEDNRTSLDTLAASVGLSKFALLRAFDRVLGVTPGEFARTVRQDRFHRELRAPAASVTDAVYAAGYGSSSRAYESADDALGMTPSAMRAGGAGETIHFGLAESPLGLILAARTQRGLCAVLFADSAGEAELDLRERFPQAVLRRDDAELSQPLAHIVRGLREPAAAVGLALDVRATAFQRRVWQALREIPRGETRTYAQIAEEIGSPKSVRAVGAACGANPLALVVPCHRVIGANGALTGYRWGKDRKRRLLEIEGAA